MHPSKCHFALQEVEFLGHLVSCKGVRPDPKKLNSVADWPTPNSADDIRRFLGLANFYHKFVQNFAKIAQPLNSLLQKGKRFAWSEECKTAFQTLKNALVSAPILAAPNLKQNFVLSTDASNFAIGAVLAQIDDSGLERPIAYYSKALRGAPTRYPTTEKECLAVVEALKHFRPYLYRNKFTLYTDHSALLPLLTKQQKSPRMERWSLALQEFVSNMQIIHHAKNKNLNADALSRRPDLELESENSINKHCFRIKTPKSVETQTQESSIKPSNAAQNPLKITSVQKSTFSPEIIASLQCSDTELVAVISFLESAS